MSTRSKAFFAFAVVTTAITVPYAHYFQKEQREVLHQGPLKDAVRRHDKTQEYTLNAEQAERESEYEEQKKLFAAFSKDQEVKRDGK